MNDPVEFERRLAREVRELADSHLVPVDPYAVVEAVAGRPHERLPAAGWLVATAAIVTLAAIAGVSLRSVMEAPPPSSSMATRQPLPIHVAWESVPGHPGVGHDPMLNQWMGGIVAGGPGYVAWGLDEHPLAEGTGAAWSIWVSDDGRAWRAVEFELETMSHRAHVTDVAAGPGGVVAIGSVCCEVDDAGSVQAPSARWFSADGDAWTRVRATGLQPDSEGALAVVAGPGGFVEAGTANNVPTVWFSNNGIAWDAISLAVAGFDAGVVQDITVDEAGYVAVGAVTRGEQSVGAVWRSDDGRAWTQLGADDPVLSGGRSLWLDDVVAFPSGLFVTGSRELPKDEQTCEPPTWPGPPPAQNAPTAGARATSRAILAALACTFSQPVRLVSSDGVHWTEVPARRGDALKPGDFEDFRLVGSGGPGLIAIGTPFEPEAVQARSTVWTSVDGIAWTRAAEDPPLSPGERVNAFVVTDDAIVAVGQVGNSAAAWIGRWRADLASQAPAPP